MANHGPQKKTQACLFQNGGLGFDASVPNFEVTGEDLMLMTDAVGVDKTSAPPRMPEAMMSCACVADSRSDLAFRF